MWCLLRLDWRPERRDVEQAVDGTALLIVELAAELGRVHVGLALGGRHIAQLEEGAVYDMLTVLGQTAELGHCVANLLTLNGGEPLHYFCAFKDLLALVGRHVIQLREPLMELLLLLRGKVVKARFVFERELLLREREVAVGLHPGAQMHLGLAGAVRDDEGCSGRMGLG